MCLVYSGTHEKHKYKKWTNKIVHELPAYVINYKMKLSTSSILNPLYISMSSMSGTCFYTKLVKFLSS